jgi:hypothetical protein
MQVVSFSQNQDMHPMRDKCFVLILVYMIDCRKEIGPERDPLRKETHE